MDNQNNSSVNTVLIVVILLILVGSLVWFFTKSPKEPEAGFKIDVNLPAGKDELTTE